jgi:hypothetical protein
MRRTRDQARRNLKILRSRSRAYLQTSKVRMTRKAAVIRERFPKNRNQIKPESPSVLHTKCSCIFKRHPKYNKIKEEEALVIKKKKAKLRFIHDLTKCLGC